MNGQNGVCYDRRTLIARAYLRGRSQDAIAREVGCCQATVSRELTALRDEWKAECSREFAERQAEAFAQLDEVYFAAWAAWEKSGGNAVLRIVLRCVEMKLKILGMLKPDAVVVVPSPIDWDSLTMGGPDPVEEQLRALEG